jgi:type IV secretory pathway protease TraF
MSASIIAILMSSLAEAPFLIYNASSSAPLGLYFLERRMPSRGELAVFKPPLDIELLIMAHGVLPAPVPLLKQIAGARGDEICRAKEPVGTISVN